MSLVLYVICVIILHRESFVSLCAMGVTCVIYGCHSLVMDTIVVY